MIINGEQVASWSACQDAASNLNIGISGTLLWSPRDVASRTFPRTSFFGTRIKLRSRKEGLISRNRLNRIWLSASLASEAGQCADPLVTVLPCMSTDKDRLNMHRRIPCLSFPFPLSVLKYYILQEVVDGNSTLRYKLRGKSKVKDNTQNWVRNGKASVLWQQQWALETIVDLLLTSS